MFTVLLRFYEELNDFLPWKHRKCEYAVTSNDARSVKDLIESEGVPHTEVDLILVNGESVGFEYKFQKDDRLSVYSCFETLDITRVSRLGRPTPLSIFYCRCQSRQIISKFASLGSRLFV